MSPESLRKNATILYGPDWLNPLSEKLHRRTSISLRPRHLIKIMKGEMEVPAPLSSFIEGELRKQVVVSMRALEEMGASL